MNQRSLRTGFGIGLRKRTLGGGGEADLLSRSGRHEAAGQSGRHDRRLTALSSFTNTPAKRGRTPGLLQLAFLPRPPQGARNLRQENPAGWIASIGRVVVECEKGMGGEPEMSVHVELDLPEEAFSA